MTKYVYQGSPRSYATVNGEPVAFLAVSGDTQEFDEAPDSDWVPEGSEKPSKAVSAPVETEPGETPTETTEGA